MVNKKNQTLPPADSRPSAGLSSFDWRKTFYLWLVTRLALSLWALGCSVWLPSEGEKQISAWPPRAPISQWLINIFLEPWNRWDVEHFLKIAERGYNPHDGTLAFHPLYPLLGRWASVLAGGNKLFGLFIVSNVCAILFLICLERLARFDLPDSTARRAVFCFLAMPSAFILFAPYTEPLFLLCSTLSLINARQGRWFLASSAGAFAVLTRQQGIFLLLPLLAEFWQWSGETRKGIKAQWPKALNLLLIPAALLLWVSYRATALSDVSVDWHRPQTLIYGLLISQSAHQIVADQQFVPPWQAISIAVESFNLTNALDLLAGCFYLIILVMGGKRLWCLRPSYLLYAVLILTVSFSLSTGRPGALMGLPRHCLLVFPFAFLLADWAAKRPVNLMIEIMGGLWLMLLTMFYVTGFSWVP